MTCSKNICYDLFEKLVRKQSLKFTRSPLYLFVGNILAFVCPKKVLAMLLKLFKSYIRKCFNTNLCFFIHLQLIFYKCILLIWQIL
jgi:hypothetical protein